jgi:hypothetical protein
MKALVFAFVLIATTFSPAVATDPKAPYEHVPAPADTVRLDGSLGGAKFAWAYPDRKWLDQFLQVTIDAAAEAKDYSQESDRLHLIAPHVTQVANGTKASVESIQPFAYRGHIDVEVRVLVQEGPQRGQELWTTCAELVDNAGHRFVRL